MRSRVPSPSVGRRAPNAQLQPQDARRRPHPRNRRRRQLWRHRHLLRGRHDHRQSIGRDRQRRSGQHRRRRVRALTVFTRSGPPQTDPAAPHGRRPAVVERAVTLMRQHLRDSLSELQGRLERSTETTIRRLCRRTSDRPPARRSSGLLLSFAGAPGNASRTFAARNTTAG